MERELRYVIYINALPNRVAQALRDGQPIVAVIPGSELRSTFETGAEYAYVGRGPDGSEMKYVFGKVLASDGDRRLQMTYRTAANPAESRVTYELEPVADKYTKLSVVQDRFAGDDPNYAANETGWPQLLSNLKSFIETGTVMKYH
ncbi:MAG: SRPBCC domain-containing protein [Candidatus Eremiobacteraeota bacterium]|nr:SRPBCC domain-containing protein [Candidatus Eremiobacteraeota bacterium]